MFEDKHMLRFVYVLLGVFSIMIPGPIIPMVSLIIAICFIVHKIKRAQESPEGLQEVMFDVIILVIVIVINISFVVMRIAIEKEYGFLDKYSSSQEEEMTTEELAETLIVTYQLGNLSQFEEKGNHIAEIKKGFKKFLQDEMGIVDVTLKGNKITCNLDGETIIFTIIRNDITFDIK